MAKPVAAYIEAGSKRVFAGVLDWPGWCRSAKTEDDALAALDAYRDRYAAAIATSGIKLPAGTSFEIVERLRGDAGTDFGVPSIAPSGDAIVLTPERLRRQVSLLVACWSAFDAAAKKASRKTLSLGPRGGGRQVAAIVEHVMEAERAYASMLGRKIAAGADVREALLDGLDARNRGEPDQRPRAKRPPWPARYAVRRSAWHALDHAWEIEDRS